MVDNPKIHRIKSNLAFLRIINPISEDIMQVEELLSKVERHEEAKRRRVVFKKKARIVVCKKKAKPAKGKVVKTAKGKTKKAVKVKVVRFVPGKELKKYIK